jgi:hypothetical protein
MAPYGERKLAHYRSRGLENVEEERLQLIPLGNFASRSPMYRCHTLAQGCQPNATLPVIDQGPLRGTFVAQPVVFDHSLLFPRPRKGRCRCAGLRKLFGFHQKQFAFSKSEKRLAALIVRTPA